MTDIKTLIPNLRKNEYYSKLINILVLNGLLDIFEDEFKDNKIDYLPLILNIITFLHTNRRLFNKFSPESMENIIIISVDEVLTKKFNIEIDDKQLEMALQLLRNSQLYKSVYKGLKNLILKIYNRLKLLNCYKAKAKTVTLELNSI